MTIARLAIVRSAAALLACAALPPAAPVASATPVAEPDMVEAVAAPAPALAPAPEPLPAFEEPELAPGEFVWKPERAGAGPVEIVVSIPLQRAYVYRGGTLIAVSTVSTGKKGHRTPTGTFPILQKRPKHFSSLYNDAPMPFMQRLTWDGIALHAGQIPGHPASHGCVRLPLAFAKHLFGVTKIGATVHIVPQSPSANEALAMAKGGGAYTGMGGPLEELDAPDDK
ncbi:MAG TPA: L,D-transpeptidase family protein [Allosphingosinicella sp.]|jgi:lipoprotein-anchoring transpeptidase ErfK/SrfK